MTAVRKAEKYLHESQISKAYKGLAGDEVFREKIRELVLGDAVEAGRVATLQTPGGTGAIRQLYEVIRQLNLERNDLDQRPNMALASGDSGGDGSENSRLHLF